MKRTLPFLAALSLLAAVKAQGAMTITVDEYGHGTYDDGLGNITPLVFSPSAADPTPGGHPTLSYTLPYSVVSPGDVILTEPGGQFSDVIRFVGNTLYFYSDRTVDDPPDPFNFADTLGLPVGNITGPKILAETGPEAGPNGYWGYVPSVVPPGTYDPGYTFNPPITGIGQPIYNFISDVAPIPEPTTTTLASALLLLPVLASGLRNLRKRQAA